MASSPDSSRSREIGDPGAPESAPGSPPPSSLQTQPAPRRALHAQDYSVFTPERVSLQYDIAGIGSRGAAALIDTAIQIALVIALLIVFAFQGSQLERVGLELPSWLPLLVVTLGLFLLLWGYYLLFEIVWSGQTPGKRALGLRVMRENGYPVRPVDSVVRNLVRVIDAPPFGFAVGVIAMLLNDRAKRLGDFAAGTIVIREARRRAFQQVALTSPAAPSATAATTAPVTTQDTGNGTPVTLGHEEASLVRDFLVRRWGMDPAARAALAHQLADHLAQRYGLHAQRPQSDEAFLESLVTG